MMIMPIQSVQGALNTPHADPEIVGKSQESEGDDQVSSPSLGVVVHQNPQSQFLKIATKQRQRKMQYQQEQKVRATTNDLNQLYRRELEEGRVRPIQETKNTSDLDDFRNKLSTLSTDELEAVVDENVANFEDLSKKELPNDHHNQSPDADGSWKRPSSSGRIKSVAATVQSELLAESVKKKKQQQRPLMFHFFSDETNNSNHKKSQTDLNDVLRHEMLMRKVNATRSSFVESPSNNSTTLTNVDANDSDSTTTTTMQEMHIHTAVAEAAAASNGNNSWQNVGEALLAGPANFLNNSVSSLSPSWVGGMEQQEDAAEALHNQEVDESGDVILHLVS